MWYDDLQRGTQPYIRTFENYVGMLMGYPPESCDQRGMCSLQNVIEANGDVYPCDFYVLDEYRLGNLQSDSFEDIRRRCAELKFVENSADISTTCHTCEYFPICRGGCRRHRVPCEDGNKSRFCAAYRMFFPHALSRLQRIASALASGQSPTGTRV